jgi:hypothetical protein
MCSVSCANAAKGKPAKVRDCSWCGTAFPVKKVDQTFCSLDCSKGSRREIDDLSGFNFNEWTVLAPAVRSVDTPKAFRASAAMWHCKCRCGAERVLSGATIRNRSSFSCGHDRRYMANVCGVDLTVADAALVLGISEAAIRSRIHRGLPLDETDMRGRNRGGRIRPLST